MNRSMYMMVSIPACSLETVYEPPVILGVFETNKLSRYTVPLTFVQHFDREETP